jgi:outer membrane protein W
MALVVFGGTRGAQACPRQGEDGPPSGEPVAARLEVRPWRVSFDAGLWSSSTAALPTIAVAGAAFTSERGGLLGGLSLGYRVTPEWVANLRMETRLLEASAYDGGRIDQNFGRAAMIMSFSLGARYYLPPFASRSAVKPYVSAGLGPVLALDVKNNDLHGWPGQSPVGERARLMAAFGGHLGAGVDFQVSNWLVLGADVAHHLTSDFSRRLAGHKNGSGLTIGFQFGVNLGRRMSDRSSRQPPVPSHASRRFSP